MRIFQDVNDHPLERVGGNTIIDSVLRDELPQNSKFLHPPHIHFRVVEGDTIEIDVDELRDVGDDQIDSANVFFFQTKQTQ